MKVSTGELKWHYQAVPNDNWDYDNVQQMILADLTINGRPRKVLMQASKDGIFYVLDRITGQFISGQAYTQVNWTHGFDESGPPHDQQGRLLRQGTDHDISDGGRRPQLVADVFRPDHRPGLYSHHLRKLDLCRRRQSDSRIPMATPDWRAAFLTERPNSMPFIGPQPLGKERGVLEAWDPVTQKLVWRTPGGGGIGGGVVTTAGNLVFQVVNDGRLLAYSADKGEKLFELQTGRTGMGPPITYEVDGKQYVALMGGLAVR